MKQLISAVCSICLLAACNNSNSGKEQPVTKLEIPVQEKEMKDAITQHPDSIPLRDSLIEYYYRNGDYDGALSELNHALVKDSNNASLWDKKGRLCLENGDTLNSILSYQKAINIFPDPQFILSLAWIYAEKKDSNALVMADALLFGKNAHAEKEALLIKGLYFSTKGDKEKALLFFDKSLALDYTFMHGYREKAIVLYDLGKYEDALRVLDKALTVKANYDEGYYWMGRCFEKLNRTNDAIDSYHSAIQFNPDYAEAKDALGKLGVK